MSKENKKEGEEESKLNDSLGTKVGTKDIKKFSKHVRHFFF